MTVPVFFDLHKSLNDPDVKEMIPCICGKCRDSEDPNLFDFAVLKRYKDKGVIDIRCPNSIENVSVENLVNGIEKTLRLEDLTPSQVRQIFSIGDDSNQERMKIIKIFLASSGRLKEEREKIELEFSRRNSQLISQGIYLELNIWEKASAAFIPERKQDEFNQMVLESDVFICLIFDRLGEFTLEEFNIAFQSFLKGKKPRKIYVYFKNAPIDSAKITKEFQAVLEFKEQIQKYEQFYNEYRSLADLILQAHKNLDMDLLELI